MPDSLSNLVDNLAEGFHKKSEDCIHVHHTKCGENDEYILRTFMKKGL